MVPTTPSATSSEHISFRNADVRSIALYGRYNYDSDDCASRSANLIRYHSRHTTNGAVLPTARHWSTEVSTSVYD